MDNQDELHEEIINFQSIVTNFAKDFYKENFSTLGNPPNDTLQSMLDKSEKEFNKFKMSTLFTTNSPALDYLVEFLKSKVPMKMVYSLALNWPACVPFTVPEIKPLFFLFVKFAQMIQNKDLYLFWLSRKIFPKIWSTKNFKQNSIIAAVSRCSTKKYGKDLWAILDTEYRVSFYSVADECAEPVRALIIYDITASPEKQEVICLDQKGSEIIRFKPNNQKHVNYWATIIDPQKRTPFPYFLSEGNSPYPRQLKIALYECLTTIDTCFLRCLTRNDVMTSNQQKGIESLFQILCHAGKYPLFLESLVANEFDNENISVNQILRGTSPLTQLFKIVNKVAGKKYFDNVISKIIKYIDSKGDLKINKPDECDKELLEKTFFTVFKYIFSSIQYVPPEMRHVANVMRTFVIVRFNDKECLKNCLSAFFFLRFFTAALTNPAFFDPTFKVNNRTSVLQFSQLFQTACNFKLMSLKSTAFTFMDSRIEKHLFPKLEHFLYSVADYETPPVFKAPSEKELDEALTTVLDTIAMNHEHLVKHLKLALNPNMNMGPTIGWVFASAVSSMFQQSIDKDQFENNGEAPVSVPNTAKASTKKLTIQGSKKKAEQKIDMRPRQKTVMKPRQPMKIQKQRSNNELKTGRNMYQGLRPIIELRTELRTGEITDMKQQQQIEPKTLQKIDQNPPKPMTNNTRVRRESSIKEPSVKEPIVKKPSAKSELLIKEPSVKSELSVKEPSVKESSIKEPSVKSEFSVKEPSVKGSSSKSESSIKGSAVKEPSSKSELSAKESSVKEPSSKSELSAKESSVKEPSSKSELSVKESSVKKSAAKDDSSENSESSTLDSFPDTNDNNKLPTLDAGNEDLPPLTFNSDALPQLETGDVNLPTLATQDGDDSPVKTINEDLPPLTFNSDALPQLETGDVNLPTLATQDSDDSPVKTINEDLPPLTFNSDALPQLETGDVDLPTLATQDGDDSPANSDDNDKLPTLNIDNDNLPPLNIDNDDLPMLNASDIELPTLNDDGIALPPVKAVKGKSKGKPKKKETTTPPKKSARKPKKVVRNTKTVDSMSPCQSDGSSLNRSSDSESILKPSDSTPVLLQNLKPAQRRGTVNGSSKAKRGQSVTMSGIMPVSSLLAPVKKAAKKGKVQKKNDDKKNKNNESSPLVDGSRTSGTDQLSTNISNSTSGSSMKKKGKGTSKKSSTPKEKKPAKKGKKK